MKRFLAAAAGIALTLQVVGCSAGGAAAPAEAGGVDVVKVGVIPTTDTATVYIAQDEGFFADEGLKVETQVIQNAASIVPSVLNGQLDVGTAATPPFLTAGEKGLPLKAIASGADVPTEAAEDPSGIIVAAGSDIKTPKDLEGKTVAVNALSAMLELVAKEAVSKDGGDPRRVTFVALPFPEMISALKRGDVDAASIVEPFFSAGLADGATPIARPYTATFKPGGTYVVYFSSDKLIAGDSDKLAKFTRAVDKASELAAANPEKVRDVMVKYGKMSPEVAKKMHLPAYSPGIDVDAIQKTVSVMEDQGFLKEGTVDANKVVHQ